MLGQKWIKLFLSNGFCNLHSASRWEQTSSGESVNRAKGVSDDGNDGNDNDNDDKDDVSDDDREWETLSYAQKEERGSLQIRRMGKVIRNKAYGDDSGDDGDGDDGDDGDDNSDKKHDVNHLITVWWQICWSSSIC